MNSAWIHSICDDCWKQHHPEQPDPGRRRTSPGKPDKCCFCGKAHESGIYTRRNPESDELLCDASHDREVGETRKSTSRTVREDAAKIAAIEACYWDENTAERTAMFATGAMSAAANICYAILAERTPAQHEAECKARDKAKPGAVGDEEETLG